PGLDRRTESNAVLPSAGSLREDKSRDCGSLCRRAVRQPARRAHAGCRSGGGSIALSASLQWRAAAKWCRDRRSASDRSCSCRRRPSSNAFALVPHCIVAPCSRRIVSAGMRGRAMAIEHEVAIRPDILYAEHDEVKLLGDLYLPKSREKVPVLIGVHGGGYQ